MCVLNKERERDSEREIAKYTILLDNTPHSKSHGLNLKIFRCVFLCLINLTLPKILSLLNQSCISLDSIHIIKTLDILEVSDEIILVYFLFLETKKKQYGWCHILIMKYYRRQSECYLCPCINKQFCN
jgi:hypothetical protein